MSSRCAVATDQVDRAWIEATVASLQAWLDIESAFPTSELTGGGAVGHVERRLSEMHGGRATFLVPSATYGMRGVLAALGVRRGDEVLVPQLDWPATFAAVRSLGATAVPVPVTTDTLTIDPKAAAMLRTSRTRAVVACHPFAVPADVPALRRALPRVPIVEDCAQAFGSTLDGALVGTLGDAAVFSFGPGKTLDVGEAGAVMVRERELFDNLLRQSAHPIRQKVSGIDDPELSALAIRVHPVAAALLNSALDRFDAASLVAEHRELAAHVAGATHLSVLGTGPRRGVASSSVALDAVRVSGVLLPARSTTALIELHDIASLVSGAPKTHPITVVGRTRRPRTAVEFEASAAARPRPPLGRTSTGEDTGRVSEKDPATGEVSLGPDDERR